MPGRKILVVDDEPGLLLTLAANLELEGFTVLTASSGEDALKVLETESPDLLISDIRMPGMNGVDLFRHVKKLRPGMPFVVMTAFALEELVKDAMQEGVFTVLPKPFEIDHVVALAARALGRPLVLVLDDDEPVAKSTAAALETLGIRALAATDAETAIQIVLDGATDVCLVDLVMPGIDGVEVMTRLREVAPDAAVIAWTGHAVEELISKAAALGAFACMRKPVKPGDLALAIAKARGTRGKAAARA